MSLKPSSVTTDATPEGEVLVTFDDGGIPKNVLIRADHPDLDRIQTAFAVVDAEVEVANAILDKAMKDASEVHSKSMADISVIRQGAEKIAFDVAAMLHEESITAKEPDVG